jgi:bifunctional ADP-heptose synthase (sugar kinase/adenylyltransferase)
MTKDKIVVTCGDYDLLNVDDYRFLQKCKERGDWLIVGLNSDMLVTLKTGDVRYTYDDRQELLLGLRCVDEVLRFNDADGTSINLLKAVKLFYPQADITYVSKYDMHNMPETRIRGITFEVIN